MENYEEKLVELIKPLFDDFGYEMKEATDEQLKRFVEVASANKVPEKGIIELKRFYKVLNGIPCLDIDIYKSDDPMIYEFWKQQKQLWIGQRDMDMIRWKEGYFHLGSIGELNYGKEYVFEHLLDLLRKGFKDWYSETNGKYPN